MFGEVVCITCDEEGITLNNVGNSEVETTTRTPIKMEDINEYVIVEGGKFETTYSLRCLQLFMSAYKIHSEVNIHFTSEQPLYLVYNISESSTIKFWISPRIETD